MWHESILGTIGDTPLVKITRLAPTSGMTVLAKLEFFNPGSSVKDRIGIAMIESAEKEGSLKPGGTIVEGTSGNTGAGVALAAIARGYKCIFTTTDKQSPEKADMLRALGAQVLVCPTNVDPTDPKSYYSVAARLAREIPGAVYLNQYDNPANAAVHYETTGPEIWEQTEGRVTHLVATAGTGGTISGIARFLKEKNPDVRVIGVDPYGSVYHKYFHTGEFDAKEIYPYVSEGAGEDILAGNMDFGLVDDFVRVTDKDTMLMTRRLAREEGFFVGQSSGMAMQGTVQWIAANRSSIPQDSVIVVILPDTGFRYLSKTYNDAWMQNHGFLENAPMMSVADILESLPSRTPVVSVSPNDTLGAAAELMMSNGISQLPVTTESEVVGSLTDADLLTHLLEHPDARSEQVATAMGAPPHVVPESMQLQQLVDLLGKAPGAVLVPIEPDGNYEIITKSDLIGILSRRVLSGQNGRDS